MRVCGTPSYRVHYHLSFFTALGTYTYIYDVCVFVYASYVRLQPQPFVCVFLFFLRTLIPASLAQTHLCVAGWYTNLQTENVVKAHAFCIENPRICVWCWHAVRTFLWVINLTEAPPPNRKEQQKSKTKCHIIYYCAMLHSPPVRTPAKHQKHQIPF